MEKRIVTVSERAMKTTVNDIEQIESQSYNGVAVIEVYNRSDHSALSSTWYIPTEHLAPYPSSRSMATPTRGIVEVRWCSFFKPGGAYSFRFVFRMNGGYLGR